MAGPAILLIGAAKAGTTSLTAWLGGHPAIAVPRVSEPGWLAVDPQTGAVARRFPSTLPAPVAVRSAEAYEALFPDRPLLGLDASPLYLESAGAAERAAARYPGARVVVLLREPARRAWSDYWMHVRLGLRRGDPDRELTATCHEVEASRYGALLAPWLRAYPDLLVRLSEEPDGLADALGAFLQIDPGGFPPALPHHNRGGLPSGPWRLRPPARWKPALERLVPARVQAALRAARDRASRPLPALPEATALRLRGWLRDDRSALEALRGPLPWPT